jgi:hypothetical protein
MNFGDDDDEVQFGFDHLGLPDTSAESDLQNEFAFLSTREHHIFAIDCQPAMFLKKISTSSGQKVTISQLEYVIQSVVKFMRSHILSTPDSKYAVFFYNTNHTDGLTSQKNGIYIVNHPRGDIQSTTTTNTTTDIANGSDKRYIHTLTKNFILNLQGLQNKEQFVEKIGLSPFIEGTTEWSSVILTIQEIFASVKANNSNSDRHVYLFTPAENPPMMPLKIAQRRCEMKNYKINLEQNGGKNIDKNATFAPTLPTDQTLFRGKYEQLVEVFTECESDAQRALLLLTNKHDQFDIQWHLFPLLTAFPDLFTENHLRGNFQYYNRISTLVQNNSQNLPKNIQNSSSQPYQDSQPGDNTMSINPNNFPTLSSTPGSDLTSTQFPQPPGLHGSLANKFQAKRAAQIAAARDAGEQWVSLHLPNPVSSLFGESDPANYVPEQLLASLKLYEDDFDWLQTDFAASVATTSTLTSNQTNNTDSSKSNTAQVINDELLHLQQTLPNEERAKLNKKASNPVFSSGYFQSLFPDTEVDRYIAEYKSHLRELSLNSQIREYKKRALVTLPLYLPYNPWKPGQKTPGNSSFFGLDIFPQYIETSIRASTDVKLHPVTNVEIASTTKQISNAKNVVAAPLGANVAPDGSNVASTAPVQNKIEYTLNAEDLSHYHAMGSRDVVFFGKSEVAQVKQFGPGSIRVIAFRQHSGSWEDFYHLCVPVSDNLQRSYLCYPSESKYPGSTTVCGNLIQMCYVTKRVIVAQLIMKLGSTPRLVYLVPILETFNKQTNEHSHYTCFQLVYASFKEDIREPEFTGAPTYDYENMSQDQKDSLELARNDLEREFGNVLDMYQVKLAPPKFRPGEYIENDVFDITRDSPSCHKIDLRNSVLEAKAVNLDLQRPIDELQLGPEMVHLTEAVEQAYAVLNTHLPNLGVQKAPKVSRAKKATPAADPSAPPKLTAAQKRKAKEQEVKDENAGAGAIGADEVAQPVKKSTSTRAKKVAVKAEVDDDEEEVPKRRVTSRTKAVVKAELSDESEEEPKRRVTTRNKAVKSQDSDESEDEPKRRATTRSKVVKSQDSDEDGTPKRRVTARGKAKIQDSEEEVPVSKRPTRKASMVKAEIDDEDEVPKPRTTRARK